MSQRKPSAHSRKAANGLFPLEIAAEQFAPNVLQTLVQTQPQRWYWLKEFNPELTALSITHLSAGAAAVDQLTWQTDRWFVVSTAEGTGEIAQSLMALTVGKGTERVSGLWGSIKPDVVTGQSGDEVQQVLTKLAESLPRESCLLYRAAIAYTAQWPQWELSSRLSQADILNQFGYGIPDVSRLQADDEQSVRYATLGEPWIKPLQADVYRVSVPDAWLAQPPETQFRISVVLSYKAQPHRTEQGRSRYLSTWLDWRCSRPGEPKLSFLGRVLQDYQAPEAVEEVKGSFKWAIGNRKRRDRATGQLMRLSRSDSTLQKDWAVAKRSELGQQFFVAVIGHRGWNSDPEASVPYALVIALEKYPSVP